MAASEVLFPWACCPEWSYTREFPQYLYGTFSGDCSTLNGITASSPIVFTYEPSAFWQQPSRAVASDQTTGWYRSPLGSTYGTWELYCYSALFGAGVGNGEAIDPTSLSSAPPSQTPDCCAWALRSGNTTCNQPASNSFAITLASNLPNPLDATVQRRWCKDLYLVFSAVFTGSACCECGLFWQLTITK